jgi:hypothetical protein
VYKGGGEVYKAGERGRAEEREGGGKKARLRQWTRGGITVDIQHTTGCP